MANVPYDNTCKSLHATLNSTESSSASQQASTTSCCSYDFAVHENVNVMLVLWLLLWFPLQVHTCPNYDLCQNCESKHIHSEHMMAYVTGRTSRRPGKRSKNFIAEVMKNPQPHLMGGGAAAAAHAMGESQTSTVYIFYNTGPQTTSTTTTTSSYCNYVPIFTPQENPIAAAAAAAAHLAAQQAHETAIKAAEIAAKVAHESAAQAAKNITENMAAAGQSASAAAATRLNSFSREVVKAKETTKRKVDATTSSNDAEAQPNVVPVLPSPSLESLAQFLDPQYMKTGIQILNNFSDMFAKMLDPMDNIDGDNQIYPNLRKNSTTSSAKSSVSSNLNSLGSDKKNASEKFIEKEQQQQAKDLNKQNESDVSSHVEIDDLGSDSENDSVSESFIKLDAPKETNAATTPSNSPSDKTPSAANSAQTTPPQSLDKSKVMDFAQLSADLKAHIAQEAAKESETPKETENTTDSAVNTNTITSTTTASEPVVTTTTSTSTTAATNTATPNKPEEKRAVPVYHTDQRINNAVHAMMSMGFSNEGAWLTQLLESVNGNIPEALDLMSVAQRSGSR
ncbi:ref(2)P-like [Lucilia cuprina]|nr:ref(2)P-like [Lucilia cuprina]